MSAEKGNNDNNDNLEHIRKYVQKHERYFEALGFQRPGGSRGTTRSSGPRSGRWTWPRSKD